VLRAAEQEDRLAGLTVVTTDLFPELVDWIRAGKVAATVYQRPLTQGRVALQALYQFLHHGKKVPEQQRVVPYLVMRSNVDLVLERLKLDRSDGVEPPEAEAARPSRPSKPRRPR
jgi:LacI family transcriptional regulator